jgi:hypothetical protein
VRTHDSGPYARLGEADEPEQDSLEVGATIHVSEPTSQAVSLFALIAPMVTNGIIAIIVNEHNKGSVGDSQNLYDLVRGIVYLLS